MNGLRFCKKCGGDAHLVFVNEPKEYSGPCFVECCVCKTKTKTVDDPEVAGKLWNDANLRT